MILVLSVITGVLFGLCAILLAFILSSNNALHSERNSHEVTKKALNSALRELREWEDAMMRTSQISDVKSSMIVDMQNELLRKRNDPSRNK